MSPTVHWIIQQVLLVGFIAGFGVSSWGVTKMMQRSRSAGYSKWSINPMATIAGLSVANLALFVGGGLISLGSAIGLSWLGK